MSNPEPEIKAAGAPGGDPGHGQTVDALVLWDLSGGPVLNERALKLGNQLGQRGVAVAAYDPLLAAWCLADGDHGGAPFTSNVMLEPDNHNLRLHSQGGKGRDNVWALRMIADHSNPAQTRANRSTHVIDQEMAQEWAGLDDIFRVVEKQTAVDDPELHYTMAGFLAMVTGASDPKAMGRAVTMASQGGKATRGALSIDISRNLGFASDKTNFGQFSHAMVFLKVKPPDVPTEDNPERPDVPTPGGGTQPPPGVPSVDPRYQDTVSSNPRNQGLESNPAANTTPTVSLLPRHSQAGDSNPASAIAAGSTVGGNFQVVNGRLIVNGQGVDSVPAEDDEGAVEDQTPQVGNRSKQENELGLRFDVGFLVDKAGRVARFSDDQPATPAEEGDGDIRLVQLFVSKIDASPDDGLDTLEDSNSNHEKLPKPVAKKKVQGWVKVPKPGSCECHHYDYSWHNPPPESSSSGGSSSSGSGVATPGGGGGSGTGTTTPPGPTKSPNPDDNRVPTIDNFIPPDGLQDPSPSTSSPSMQVQAGFAPPRSPGFTMRGNIFPQLDGVNPVASMVATKAATYRNVILQIVLAFSDDLVPGELIELNVVLGAHEGGAGPSTFYRQCLVFNGDDGYVSDPTEYVARFYFDGFDPSEQIFTVLIERRNDTEKGVNSSAELCTIRTSLLSDGGSQGGSNA